MLQRAIVLAATVLWSSAAHAQIKAFFDSGEWFAAVGEPFTTIHFTGYPDNTWVTHQFTHLGAVFVTPDDQISGEAWEGYEQDGWGLYGGFGDGSGGEIDVLFAEPVFYVAVHHPGAIAFDLYDGDTHVGYLCSPGTIEGQAFGGLMSSVAFDRVVMTDHIGSDPFIDNLYFGPRVSWHGDINRDGTVDLDDLLEILDRWGPCPIEDDCIGDETGDGVVGVEDLIEVILSWE